MTRPLHDHDWFFFFFFQKGNYLLSKMEPRTKKMKTSWHVPASSFSHNTFNPIRNIVDGMKLSPNPDKPMIALSIGKSVVQMYACWHKSLRNHIGIQTQSGNTHVNVLLFAAFWFCNSYTRHWALLRNIYKLMFWVNTIRDCLITLFILPYCMTNIK